MADTEDKPLRAVEEKADDEASELASLAGASADTKHPTKPSSLTGGTQDGPSVSSPAKESSGQSPVPLKDMNNGATNGTSKLASYIIS